MPDISSLNNAADSVTDNMSTAQLPIIDISPYLDPSSSSESRQKTSTALDKACREFGE
jgi:hypothetical protein